MSNDRLLIAVNELIQAYEKGVVRSLDENADTQLDIMQISNLHKVDMFLNGMEVGNNLNLLLNVKDILDDEETFEKKSFSNSTKSEFEECSTEVQVSKTKQSNDPNIIDAIEAVDKYKSRPIPYLDKEYKLNIGSYKNFFEKYKAVEDYAREELCIDCKIPLDTDLIFPAFELSWELKQFLRNIKLLLADIKMSLNPTDLLGDFCSFFEILKKNWLCASSYPLLAAAFPILINKAKTELTELGFSWTGALGAIISPILTAATNVIEFLRNIAVPVLDCLINAINSLKVAVESLNQVINSIAQQTYSAIDAAEYVLLKDESDKKLKKILGEPDRKPEAVSDTEAVKTSNSFFSFLNVDSSGRSATKSETFLGGRLHHGRVYTPKDTSGRTTGFIEAPTAFSVGAYSRPSPNRRVDALRPIINIIQKLETSLIKAKDYVNQFFGTLIYSIKSFSRLIVEPLFVSARLIGEIKVALNMIRLIALVVKIVSQKLDGKNLCSDFNDENNNKFLKSQLEETFRRISVEFDLSEKDEETIAYIKSKDSRYSSRLEPNDCGDIFVHVNDNQRNLDLLYDSIVNNFK